MTQAFQIVAGEIYRAMKPTRDPLYRRWIKRFPCVGCHGGWQVDPAHTGPHSLGRKSSDATVIPLCRKCHEAFDANPSDFAEKHSLDVLTSIQFFQHLWELKNERNK
jgi:hypothetical protein